MAAPDNSSCFFKERAAASEKIFKNVRLPLKDITRLDDNEYLESLENGT